MQTPANTIAVCIFFYYLSNLFHSARSQTRSIQAANLSRTYTHPHTKKIPPWRNRVIITFMKSPRTFAQNGYIAICVITRGEAAKRMEDARTSKNFQAKCIPQLSQYTSTYNVTSFNEKETKKRTEHTPRAHNNGPGRWRRVDGRVERGLFVESRRGCTRV